MKFTFLITEDCFTSAVVGLLDTFAIANLWHQELTGSCEHLFTSELVSVDGRAVTSSGCIELKAHKAITEAGNVEYIILPPVFPSSQLGRHLTKAVKGWLLENNRAGVPIAGVCTGSFLLAETGLLDGRLATTNWQFARRFQRLFPKIKLRPEMILTEEDGLVCTGAATAYLNLGLSLIRRYGSEDLAEVCAKVLLVDPNRTSQAPYFFERQRIKHQDTAIEKAQRFMEENYAAVGTIDEIARHACLSPRHFKRRFKQATGYSPLSYLQKVRIELAKKKLESTLDSINDITLQIGYENASTFRRLFKDRTSLSPREYRDKFSRRK
jgi:transcriptional regulator GlxA family with amidase domain